MKRVYLDHSSTTPVREEVVESMQSFFSEEFGNPSNIHTPGQRARNALEKARKGIASVIGVDSKEVVFTSGGTESDNLAIKGVAYASNKGKHIVTSSIEHPAVLNTCRYLESQGYSVTYLPVDEHGLVSADSVKRGLRSKTVLVSIMMANNEVGTIQPIKEIGEMTRVRGIPFHTDAVQAVGKIPVKADDLNVDLISISGHKIYGPKGVGALYVRKGIPITSLMHGGSHEQGLRPGTENMPASIGLARAMELAEEERNAFFQRMLDLRSMLRDGIKEEINDVRFNGHPEHSLPNLLNASFGFVEGETLLFSLDTKGIAVSTGSACSSGSLETSHVLTAMGVDPELATGSLRFSLGRMNDEEDISCVIAVLSEAVTKLRVVQ